MENLNQKGQIPTQNQPNLEQTLYTLAKKKSRILIPKFITIILLSSLFYTGILLNISLLSLRQSAQNQAKIYSIFLVLFLIIIGIITNIIKAKTPITFLQTKLKLSKHKSIAYHEIDNVQIKTTSLDKLFKTYQLIITNHKNKKITLGPISNQTNESQVENYLNQLVTNAKLAQSQQEIYQQQQNTYNQNYYN